MFNLFCFNIIEVNFIWGKIMKILCVLYDDPVDGMPEKYARDDLPELDKYHEYIVIYGYILIK